MTLVGAKKKIKSKVSRTSERNKRIVRYALLGTLFTIILVLAAYFIDIKHVFDTLKNADYKYLIPAIIAFLFGYVLLAARWKYVLNHRVSLTYAFNAQNAGTMFKVALLPTTLGRIVAMANNKQVSLSESSSTVIACVFFNNLMKIITLFIIFVYNSDVLTKSSDGPVAVVLFVGLIVAVVLAVKKREWLIPIIAKILNRLPIVKNLNIEGFLKNTLDSLAYIGSEKIVYAIVFSFATQILFFLFYYLSILALNTSMSTEEVVNVTLVILAFAPPTPAYLPGVYNALVIGFGALFTAATTSFLFTFSLVVYVLMLAFWLIAGIYGLNAIGLSMKDIRKSGQKFDKDI